MSTPKFFLIIVVYFSASKFSRYCEIILFGTWRNGSPSDCSLLLFFFSSQTYQGFCREHYNHKSSSIINFYFYWFVFYFPRQSRTLQKTFLVPDRLSSCESIEADFFSVSLTYKTSNPLRFLYWQRLQLTKSHHQKWSNFIEMEWEWMWAERRNEILTRRYFKLGDFLRNLNVCF